MELIDALIHSGVSKLALVNHNAGHGRIGLEALRDNGQVRKIICSFSRQPNSYVFDELNRAGQVELEWCPRATWPSASGPARDRAFSSPPPVSEHRSPRRTHDRTDRD
jgi:acyl CoA:acetate/3-ketoacid CoA transferase alpha subunit